jgi:hypothetical protein
MPRTISTKPAYSVRWWKDKKFTAPERDVFGVMRSDMRFRYESDRPTLKGQVRMGDARRASGVFPELKDRVGLVITSPPYLDTTNFMEDQWLRLWFLGGEPLASGFGRGDHRHVNTELYWTFLQEAWQGVAALLRERARIIVRIGGCRQDIDEIEEKLRATLKMGLGRRVRLIERKASEIFRSQLQSFRPALAKQRFEYDFHWSIS